MFRIAAQLLYAMLFGIVVFAVVWMGHEASAQLGHGSYIRQGDEWVDLRLDHVLPLAWKSFLQQLVPLTLVVGGLSLMWAGLVTLSLRRMRTGMQPICAYLLGAIGGVLLFLLATTKGIYVPVHSQFPLLAGTVLSLGATAYALSAIRMNPGWFARLGDLALIGVSIIFSVSWSYFLMRMVD